MMNPQITVEADGESWFLELEPNRLHHSRFTQEHHFPLHTHPAYHLILVDRRGCTLHIPQLTPVECPVRSLLLLNPEVPHRFTFGARDCEHSSFIWRFLPSGSWPSAACSGGCGERENGCSGGPSPWRRCRWFW